MNATARGLMAAGVLVVASGAVWLYLALNEPLASVGSPAPDARSQAAWQVDPSAAPRVATAIAPATTPVPPAVVLSGVAVHPDGSSNLAIVSVDRGPQTLLRVGDRLGSSAMVIRIDEASMTYRFAGNDLRVFVTAPSARISSAAKPQTPSSDQRPGFVADAPAIARANGSEPGSGNEGFRQAVERKMQAIAATR